MLNAQNLESQLCCECQLENNIETLPNRTAEPSAHHQGTGRQRQSLALGLHRSAGMEAHTTWEAGLLARTRSASPPMRATATTDTNWLCGCCAAEVTRTACAQTRGLPSWSPRVTVRSLVGAVCVRPYRCHGEDAGSVNKEHHYQELLSLRHSLQEEGGGDNHQLKPDFTGRSTTTIRALRDLTREPEMLPFNSEKQQLAHVYVGTCVCLHEPAVQTHTE